MTLGELPACSDAGKKGDGVCDSGNNHPGCEYDGGDCCLASADDHDCIDPCGVRDKFYGGTNSQYFPPLLFSFCRFTFFAICPYCRFALLAVALLPIRRFAILIFFLLAILLS